MANAVCILGSSDTETGQENDISICIFVLFWKKKNALACPIITDKYIKNYNGFSIFRILTIEIFNMS